MVLMPTEVEEQEFVDCIMTLSLARDLEVLEVWAPSVVSGQPITGIATALGVCWGSSEQPRNVSAFLGGEDLPDIILLQCMQDLSESDRGSWSVLLEEWSDASKAVIESGSRPTSIVSIVRAECLTNPPSSALLRN